MQANISIYIHKLLFRKKNCKNLDETQMIYVEKCIRHTRIQHIRSYIMVVTTDSFLS